MSRTLLAALILMVGGCHLGPPAPPPPPPPVKLCLEASPRLNWYNNSPHTLYVRLFQLSALDAFTQAEPGRLLDPQLNLSGQEGPAFERTVYPGTTVTVDIPPKADAQFIGLVAGYYRLSGSAKADRPVLHGEEAEKAEKKKKKDDKPDCVQLGPNGIGAP